jgi:hypothetical protein
MRLSDIKDDDRYTIKTSGRRILGKHLKNPYLRKGINEEIQRRKEEVEDERRFYLNIGDTPVLQFRTEPPAYIIHSNFQGLRDILLELDLPEDPCHVYCSVLFRGSDIKLDKKKENEEFQQYSVEIFGLLLRLPGCTSYDLRGMILHETKQYKSQPRYWSSRSGHIMQIWRTRLFPCTVNNICTSPSNPLSPLVPTMVYMEERWHRQGGLNQALYGLEYIDDSQVPFIHFISDALYIFRRKRKLGRPAWSGEFKSPELFHKAYEEARSNLLLRTGDNPKQQAIANELGITLANLKSLKRKARESGLLF